MTTPHAYTYTYLFNYNNRPQRTSFSSHIKDRLVFWLATGINIFVKLNQDNTLQLTNNHSKHQQNSICCNPFQIKVDEVLDSTKWDFTVYQTKSKSKHIRSLPLKLHCKSLIILIPGQLLKFKTG